MRAGFLVFAGIALWASAGLMAQTNAQLQEIAAQQAEVAQAPGSASGSAWLRLAALEQDAAHYDDAVQEYRRAIALLKNGSTAELAMALDRMGTLYVELGQYGKAEPLERKALALRLEAGDKRAIGTSYAHLANLEFGKRDLGLAETNAEMAVSLLAPAQASDATAGYATPEEQMSAMVNLALVRCAAGKCDEAKPLIRRALAIAHAHYKAYSVPVGFLDFLTGYAEWRSGSAGLAAEPMRRGIAELGTQLGWGHPTYVQALTKYKEYLQQTGKNAEAAEVEAKLAKLGRGHSGGAGEQSSIAINVLP